MFPGKAGSSTTITAGKLVKCTFTPGSGASFIRWDTTRFSPSTSTRATKWFRAGNPGTGTIVGKYRDAGGRWRKVTYTYRIRKAVSADKSVLKFAPGKVLRYVPADGEARTKLVAVVKDKNGKAMANRWVRLEHDGETVKGTAARKTNSAGKALFTLTASSPESVRFDLVDAATDTKLGQKTVHFTRKVVVLVMGFNSSLDKPLRVLGLGQELRGRP